MPSATPTRKRKELQWEQAQAAVSLAGIRPLVQSSSNVGASAEATYTVGTTGISLATRRVVVYHIAAGGADIRIDLNATAGATDFPVAPGTYFVLDVEAGDVVHVYNTSAVTVTVHFLEVQ